MPPYSKDFQFAHDIDWIAKVGSIYVYALSFGGLLPSAINERNRNFSVLRSAFKLPVVTDDIIYNESYLEARLKPQTAGDNAEYERRRARYLLPFNKMAVRGFYAFDRDIFENNIYHLIARPRDFILRNWFNGKMPELPIEVLQLEDYGGLICLV